jgi:hypothetical protein
VSQLEAEGSELAWAFGVVVALVGVVSPVLSSHQRAEAVAALLFLAFVLLVWYCNQRDSEESEL